MTMKPRHAFGVIAALVLLSGCASKEPMDYLPECAMYFGANMSKLRQQAGAMRLSKALEALEPASAGNSEKVSRFVGGLHSFNIGARPAVFGVVTGLPGLSNAVIEDARKTGNATETKIDGKRAVSFTGGAVFVELTDAAMLMAGSESDITVMQQTARNKNPRGKNTLVYQRFNTLLGDHGVVVVANTEPVLSLARPQLAMIEKLDPKGYAAINKVKIAALMFDWDSAPKLQLTLFLDNKEDSDALAALINNALLMAKMQPGVNQQISPILSNLTAKGEASGASMVVEIPKEQADEFLEKAEKAIADLPKDPKEREKAAQRLLMELMTSGAAGTPSATDSRMAPAPLPGAAPAAARPGAMVPQTAPGLTVPAQSQQQMPAQQPMAAPAFTPPAAAATPASE
jgi:outer membrane murein-binding lipoprotein Lpp